MPLNTKVKKIREHSYGDEKVEVDESNARDVRIDVGTEYNRKNVVMKLGSLTITAYPSTENLLNLTINDDETMEAIERALVIMEDRIQHATRDIEVMTDKLKDMFPKEALLLLMKGDKNGN